MGAAPRRVVAQAAAERQRPAAAAHVRLAALVPRAEGVAGARARRHTWVSLKALEVCPRRIRALRSQPHFFAPLLEPESFAARVEAMQHPEIVIGHVVESHYYSMQPRVHY